MNARSAIRLLTIVARRAVVTLSVAAVALLAMASSANAIFNGVRVPPNEYPFVAFFQSPVPNRPGSFEQCTGTLIRPDWILTAAHCFGNRPAQNGISVMIGRPDLVNGRSGFQARSDRWYTHPAYNGGNTFDVALIHLAASLPPWAPTVKVATKQDYNALKLSKLTTIGYGSSLPFLTQTNPVFSRDSGYGFRNGIQNGNVVTTVPPPGQNVGPVPGDSGGPLLARNAAGEWVQLGVTCCGDISNQGKPNQQVQNALFGIVGSDLIRPWIGTLLNTTRTSPPLALPTAPQQVAVVGIPGGVRVSWAAPAIGGPVTGYRVHWMDGTDQVREIAPEQRTFDITGLRAGVTYAIDVSARNAAGLGPSVSDAGAAGALGSPPTIVTTQLPAATAGKSYSATLDADGGSAPYRWSLATGALPDGLSLSGDGTVAGMTAATGNFSFGARVVDASGVATSATVTLVVNDAAALAVVAPDGTIVLSRSCVDPETYPLTAVGGTKPYTWSIASGTPPQGVLLSSAGVLSLQNPPGGSGSTFTVQVADAGGTKATAAISVFVVNCF